MASSDREQSPDLIQELLDNPHDFDFFQAVRLIEIFMSRNRNHAASSPIAGDLGPRNEPIRFRALASLSFPPGEIAGIRSAKKSRDAQSTEDHFPVDMTVPFMGLTGPNGVLPQHYTSLVIERSHQRNKDDTLREFFDLFNHRLISFYYRAWEKYRFQFLYERNLHEAEIHDDRFTRCLFSLSGLDLPGLRHRFSIDDQVLVFYGGLIAQQHRNAAGLEQILSSYFGIEATVEQFVGQWLYLSEDLQSQLPSRRSPQGENLVLGESAVAGSRAWDLQSRFRVRLGPLNRREFNDLLPAGTRLTAVRELIRFYVGSEKDFDIQLVLRREDVPATQLPERTDDKQQVQLNGSRLGWNSWLGTPDSRNDADDAVFHF